MIKLYLDWNVINQMKRGLHTEISEIIKNSKNYLLFYSTSHIGDILSSYANNEEQKRIIKEDLNYLSEITNNNCLSISSDAELMIDHSDPEELFQQRIEFLEDDFGFDFSKKIFEDIENDEDNSDQIKQLVELGKLQINILENSFLGDDFVNALSNPESSKIIDQMLPGVRENPTIGGMVKALNILLSKMNNETAYGDLRSFFQNALQVDPKKSINWNDPFKEYNKTLQKLGNNNLEQVEKIMNNVEHKSIPSWYLQITNSYINLDMVGYKQDKVEVKDGKKKTFKNTREDAFHAAFSSTCDLYVLNDKKGYLKTKEVFKHLNINTLVLNPIEFVEFHKDFVEYEQGYNTINLIIDCIKSNTFDITEDGDYLVKRLHTFSYFFGYFNVINIQEHKGDKTNFMYLSREDPTNGKFIFLTEINSLIERMSSYFGDDLNNLGKINFEEFKDYNNWGNRIWNLGDYKLYLANNENHIRLYFVFNN